MRIDGTITLADGTESSFSVDTEYGWQQWGADNARLGRSVAILDALEAALYENAEDEPEA